MIAGIRTWLLGIVFTAFAVSLAKELAGSGREGKWVSFAGGLLIILALLRPMSEISGGNLSSSRGEQLWSASDQISSYEESYMQELSAIIAEKTEAYIWDKGQSLGLDLEVSVEVQAQDTGVPLPYAVTVIGSYSQTLADWMEKEVGLPTERQIWLEAQVWSETREDES